MEKRILGVALTILGIIGLIMAGVNFIQNGGSNNASLRAIAMYGIIGLIFFIAGIGLVRNTKDVVKRDGRIS